MENEIGEYGRTNFGRIIDKFAFLTNQNGEINTNKVILIKDNKLTRDFYYFEKGEYMLKHSSNLIDLIEEGDYVNNCRVVEHAYQKGRLFVTYLYIGGKVITTTEDYSWELTKDREDWVKSIVTKEQFESVNYKVKGE